MASQETEQGSKWYTVIEQLQIPGAQVETVNSK